MRTILIIFRKELIDSIRDRRTLITMVVIPLLLFPLLIGITSRVMISQIKKAQEKTLRVGLVTHGNAAGFREIAQHRDAMSVIENISLEEGRKIGRASCRERVYVLV